MIQFVLAIVLTALIGVIAPSAEWRGLLAACAVLWLLLGMVGLACDARRGAGAFELLRLVATVPLVDYAVVTLAPDWRAQALILTVAYVASSLLLLARSGLFTVSYGGARGEAIDAGAGAPTAIVRDRS